MNTTANITTEKETSKSKLINFMNENNIDYKLTECRGCKRLCIELYNEPDICQKHCYNTGIVVQMSNKDVCRIYPHKILYIAIENRKSVLYLTDRRIETNYQLEHWKNVLDMKTFAQPHNSFIVNFNYVDEITKDFVKIRHENKEYSVYTSSRKVNAFKKAFLNFEKK